MTHFTTDAARLAADSAHPIRANWPAGRDTIRLFLHVLAATIWVGGQLVLAALLPVLRRFGSDAIQAAARRFNQVPWAAFAVLVVTGIWNIAATPGPR